MAQKYGFFNALENNGTYDRKYNADDYTDNMAAIISTGVRRSGDNDLKVTASGLVVSVAPGRAWIEGHWYHSDTALVLETVTPPTGTLSRKDGVYLQCNTNLAARKMQLVYKTGTPATTPTAPACVRDGGIYEIMLATVTVAPNAESLTVTDTRADATVCGWITSPIGYDNYFEALDDAFNEWFTEVKDTLASVTMFRQYIWQTSLASSSSTVTFNIPQYDNTDVDIIQVFVNGLLEIPTTDYTLSGSVITFETAKAAGTDITVICYKSIDGTGLGSVADAVDELQDEVAGLGNVGQFYYFCTGNADNVAISTLVKTFLAGGSDGKKMKLSIVGSPSATAAASGSGTAASPFRWFDFEGSTGRQAILDFANCGAWNISPSSATVNELFYGDNIRIENIKLTAGSAANTLTIYGTHQAMDFINADIELTGADASNALYLIEAGNIIDSKVTVTNALGGAAVIAAGTGKHPTARGGSLKAYTGDSTSWSAPVYISTISLGAALVFGTELPEVSKTGYYQTNSIKAGSGKVSAFGMITELSTDISLAAEANIYGTI